MNLSQFTTGKRALVLQGHLFKDCHSDFCASEPDLRASAALRRPVRGRKTAFEFPIHRRPRYEDIDPSRFASVTRFVDDFELEAVDSDSQISINHDCRFSCFHRSIEDELHGVSMSVHTNLLSEPPTSMERLPLNANSFPNPTRLGASMTAVGAWSSAITILTVAGLELLPESSVTTSWNR